MGEHQENLVLELQELSEGTRQPGDSWDNWQLFYKLVDAWSCFLENAFPNGNSACVGHTQSINSSCHHD